MTAVSLAPVAEFKAFDNNGVPLLGGLLYTYIAGTSTPQATYIDSTGTTPNTNPVVLNARGEASVWLASALVYKLVLTDSLGNTIWTQDQVPGGNALSATIIGQYLYPQTPAEIAAGVTPVNYQYIPHEVRREGATGGHIADDSAAFTNAMKVAQEGLYDIPVSSYLVTGGFLIGNQVTTSYAGQGQISFKGARVHGPAVIYPTMSTNVFEIDADYLGQQEAKFKFEDLMISGDGTHYPTLLYTSDICFSEVKSINSFGSGPIVNWQYGGEHRAQNCTAFGGQIGFTMYRSHDNYVTECHAYGGTIGMQALGVGNTGTDGNQNFINCVSHVNSTYNFDVEGCYSPVINNFVSEGSPIGVYVKNCSYGRVQGGFCGPSVGGSLYSINFDGTNNYGYNIAQVNIQNEMQLTHLQTSIISDVISSTQPSSITGAAISLGTSSINLLNGCMVRNPAIAYSYTQDVTSNSNIINGGRYEQQIYIQGTKSTRGGGTIIMPNLLVGGIRTDDSTQGQFRTDEYVRFWDGTRINETGVGYLLPYLAQTGTLAASGGSATFDTATIVAVPIGGASNSTEAEFMVSGGSSGSISATKILVVRSFEIATATILGGNGARGSFTVSVSGSVITVTNPSGGAGVPYAIRMTKHVSY